MKPTPSQTKAKQMLKKHGEKRALDVAKKNIKGSITLADEVFWRGVRYHIKQILKTDKNDNNNQTRLSVEKRRRFMDPDGRRAI